MIYGKKGGRRMEREITCQALSLSHKHTSLLVGNYSAVFHSKLGGVNKAFPGHAYHDLEQNT